jgi:hypothetical protein
MGPGSRNAIALLGRDDSGEMIANHPFGSSANSSGPYALRASS